MITKLTFRVSVLGYTPWLLLTRFDTPILMFYIHTYAAPQFSFETKPFIIQYLLVSSIDQDLVCKHGIESAEMWDFDVLKNPNQAPVAQSLIKLIRISGNFNCYLFIIKRGFFTRLRFKEKKVVIYNVIGPQFCGKPSCSGK